MSPAAVVVVHVAATLFMTGAIWMVQVVHYPLFAYADRATYAAFADAHGRLITLIVGPAMLVELGAAVWLVATRSPLLPRGWALTGLVLLLVIWACTALVSVPLHGQLARGYDSRAHAALLATNWIRTLAWTARSGLVLVALARALSGVR